jgi:hypothetical protein
VGDAVKVRIVNGKVPLWTHLYLWAVEWTVWLVLALMGIAVVGGTLALMWVVFAALVRAAQ